MPLATRPVPETRKENDHRICTRDGAEINVRSYQPEEPDRPLYVMYHGGGFCVGGIADEEHLSRLLCERLGFVVVSVDYRLAPEHRFPLAHNDCWDATRWVIVEHGVPL